MYFLTWEQCWEEGVDKKSRGTGLFPLSSPPSSPPFAGTLPDLGIVSPVAGGPDLNITHPFARAPILTLPKGPSLTKNCTALESAVFCCRRSCSLSVPFSCLFA